MNKIFALLVGSIVAIGVDKSRTPEVWCTLSLMWAGLLAINLWAALTMLRLYQGIGS